MPNIWDVHRKKTRNKKMYIKKNKLCNFVIV